MEHEKNEQVATAPRPRGRDLQLIADAAGVSLSSVYRWVRGEEPRYTGPMIQAAYEQIFQTQNHNNHDQDD